MGDDITNPFLNFNQLHRRNSTMDRLFPPAAYNGYNYLSILGFKLPRISGMDPVRQYSVDRNIGIMLVIKQLGMATNKNCQCMFSMPFV